MRSVPAKLPDMIVRRRIPGTDIQPGQHVVNTRSLGVVVVRPLTPLEELAVRHHLDHMDPTDPTPARRPTTAHLEVLQ